MDLVVNRGQHRSVLGQSAHPAGLRHIASVFLSESHDDLRCALRRARQLERGAPACRFSRRSHHSALLSGVWPDVERFGLFADPVVRALFDGGEEALQNPLCIRTNRILTATWGGLYLITALWTFFLMNTAAASYTGLINSLCLIFMGIFTAWFQRWYPAKVAQGAEKSGLSALEDRCSFNAALQTEPSLPERR